MSESINLFNKFKDYSVTQTMQDRLVDLYGAPVDHYIIDPCQKQAYEENIKFTKEEIECFIKYNLSRRTFYHFKWFPNKEDESLVVMGTFRFDAAIEQGDFIRDKGNDNLFKIVKILEDGLYQPLRRLCIFMPVLDENLNKKLR